MFIFSSWVWNYSWFERYQSFWIFKKFHVLFLLQDWILHAHPTGAPFSRPGPVEGRKIWRDQPIRPPAGLAFSHNPTLLNLGKLGGGRSPSDPLVPPTLRTASAVKLRAKSNQLGGYVVVPWSNVLFIKKTLRLLCCSYVALQTSTPHTYGTFKNCVESALWNLKVIIILVQEILQHVRPPNLEWFQTF